MSNKAYAVIWPVLEITSLKLSQNDSIQERLFWNEYDALYLFEIASQEPGSTFNIFFQISLYLLT